MKNSPRKIPPISKFIVQPVNTKAQNRRVGQALQKDIRKQANRDLLKSAILGVVPSLRRITRPLRRLGGFRLRWEHIIIAFLLGLLIHGTAHSLPDMPIKPTTIKLQKTLKTPVLASQAKAEPIYVAPVVVAPTPVVGCGSDTYMAFIYQHESGCNTGSINASSGACGLGQALPCSKMGCSLSDWNCQNNFFTNYAVSRYGSTYNAYLFWISAHWW